MSRQQQVEIRMEQRTIGEGVVIALSRDVIEFFSSHVGMLHIDTDDPGMVTLEEGGQQRRLAWAEITTEMPPPE